MPEASLQEEREMNQKELIEKLFSLQDEKYRQMQVKLLPNVSPERIIGVRTPQLRAMAKQMTAGETFLRELPHTYFEEDQIHAFLLSAGKDFEETAAGVDQFLPYVNNWATCDQMAPKVFKKNHSALLPYIEKWIFSSDTYAVRFGIKMLMDHFLEADFSVRYPQMVASVKNEDYYIRMMVAWYFATALAKQYDVIFPFLETFQLEKRTHNKAIQKGIESFRITPEQKEQLKKLRIK